MTILAILAIQLWSFYTEDADLFGHSWIIMPYESSVCKASMIFLVLMNDFCIGFDSYSEKWDLVNKQRRKKV